MTTTVDVLPVVERADHVPGPPQGSWTYQDYAAIPEDGRRYEIIDGVLYVMPGPTEVHQFAVGRFTTFLTIHVDFAGLGLVLPAPFDVELVLGGSAVQPDVIVVLNAHRDIITNSRIIGAPDLVVEVASPSTATHDRSRKLVAYANAGVREYWIADPYARTVERLLLEAGAYHSLGVFLGQATLPAAVVPDFPVRVGQFFAP